MLDDVGVLRGLSGQASDITGDTLLPASIERLRRLDARTLPEVIGKPRPGPCVGAVGKVEGLSIALAVQTIVQCVVEAAAKRGEHWPYKPMLSSLAYETQR
jgi:hypothetical protein